MRFAAFFLGLFWLVMSNAALAAPEDDLKTLRADALAIAGATVTEFPDFTMVGDRARMTNYYFTKPPHYAHPAAVKRALVRQADGAWDMRYSTWPYEAPESAPASFKRWMDEFKALDQAMRDAIMRDHGTR